MVELVRSGRMGSGCHETDGSPEIEDCGETVEVCDVVAEVAVSHAGAAIEALDVAEYSLDGSSLWSDQGIASRLPVRQVALVLVRAVHDAVLDTKLPEPAPALLVLVSLVGVNRSLVATDKCIGDQALVDMRRRKRQAPDQTGSLIGADMEAIAKITAASLAGEAGRRLLRQRRLRPGFQVGPTAGSGHNGGVHQGPLAHDQLLRIELPVHFGEGRLQHPCRGAVVAEPAQRGFVRRSPVQRKAAEQPER